MSVSGNVLGRQVSFPNKYLNPATMRNWYCQDNIDNTAILKISGYPTATYPPYSLVMGDGLGLLSATTTIYQSGNITNLNLAGGLNGASTVVGTSTLTGQLGALAYLITSIIGTSTLSGNIQGAVNIAANLAGSGDLTGALGALISILADLNGNGNLTGSIAGALEATATLAGNGDLVGAIQGSVSIISNITGTSTLTSAIIGNWNMVSAVAGSSTLVSNIKAIANLVSILSGSGTITLTSGSTPGDMFCDITLCGDLTPTNVAAAVWESLAASFNNAGTMGEIMNNMGAATDPWTVVLEGTYTAGDIIKLMSAAIVGKSDIINLGGGLATIIFRDINDTENRVTATLQNSERTQVVLNP